MLAKVIYLAGAAALAIAANSAHAQSAVDHDNSTGVEEIIVTAQKRAENIQDIPKSVQVVGEAELRQSNITDISDLRKVVPSISGTGLSIRGVATGASSIGAQSKVGVTLDDVPQPSRATLANNLLDIERVEVLPGPQGTLSGRNATGGLINLVTRAPSRQLTATVNALLTTDHERQLTGYVSGPLAEQAAFSLSAYTKYLRGQAYNLTTGNWVRSTTNGVRGKLQLDPAEALTVTLTGFYQHTYGMWQTGTIISEISVPITSVTSNLDITSPRRNYLALRPGAGVGPDVNWFTSPRDSRIDTKSYGGVARIDYEIGNATLSSISSILKEKSDSLQDFTQYTLVNMNLRPEFDGYAHIANKTKYITQEVRITSPTTTRLQYVAGMFYSSQDQTYDYTRYYLPVNWHRLFGTKALAAFGHVGFDITPQLTVMGGIRYEKDKVDYIWEFFPILATTKTAENGTVVSFPKVNDYVLSTGRDSLSYTNYDAAVQYHVTDDVMVYLNYGQASQGPVFDAEDNQTAIVRSLTTLPPEQVFNWEAGFKAQLFDRNLTLNVNLFNGTYRNYQLQTNTVDTTNPNSIPVLKLASVGRVRTRGVEVNTSARLGNLRINGAVSYTDASILSYPYANCYTGQTAALGCVTIVVPGETNARPVQRDLAGKPLASAPKWRMNWNGTYTQPELAFGMDGFVSAVVNYQSSSNSDLLGNPANYLKPTTYVNASIGVRNDNFRVELLVNNLFKQKAETYGVTLGQGMVLPSGASVRTRNAMSRDNTRYFGIRMSATY